MPRPKNGDVFLIRDTSFQLPASGFAQSGLLQRSAGSGKLEAGSGKLKADYLAPVVNTVRER